MTPKSKVTGGRKITLDVAELKSVLVEQKEFLQPVVQEAVQAILELEMEECLQAGKHERTEERLGYRSGYYRRRMVTRVGTMVLRVASLYAAREAFAAGVEGATACHCPELLSSDTDTKWLSPEFQLHLSEDQIERLALWMAHGALRAATVYSELHPEPATCLARSGHQLITSNMTNKVEPSRISRVAVFVALREERQTLTTMWGLRDTGTAKYWSGRIGNAEVFLYSSGTPGRVPAALTTLELLAVESFQLIIVTGIAAGIPEERVELGNVLIPTHVVDLASRKMRDADGHTAVDFRPKEYFMDRRLQSFVDSDEFVVSDWQSSVVSTHEWPASRRPALHYEAVASLDDVVASDEWRRALHNAWPKLEGIEMEAGGVCAAAERKNTPVCLARGVSDLADPLKSDTHWRTRAIRASASLITSFLGSSFLRK